MPPTQVIRVTNHIACLGCGRIRTGRATRGWPKGIHVCPKCSDIVRNVAPDGHVVEELSPPTA